MASIKLFKGEFGHVSLLSAARDLVTHAHAEIHVILWLDGDAGEMTVGDRSVSPDGGHAIGVNSFEPHSHSFSAGRAPGTFLAFYIDPEWALSRRGMPAESRLFHHPRFPIDHWLREAALRLCDGMDFDGSAFLGYEIERLIDRLFDAALPQSTGRRGTSDAGFLDFRVRKAVELMRSNLSGRMSLDEVARSVGLSRPHFFALFKEQMNLTPNVYWNTLRMEEALRQVESSGETLTAVACNLGFSTQGNFTRFFRDHAGVPPTLYREAARPA